MLKVSQHRSQQRFSALNSYLSSVYPNKVTVLCLTKRMATNLTEKMQQQRRIGIVAKTFSEWMATTIEDAEKTHVIVQDYDLVPEEDLRSLLSSNT